MGSLTIARWEVCSPNLRTKNKSQRLFDKNYLGLLSEIKIPRLHYSRTLFEKTNKVKEFPFSLSCQGGPERSSKHHTERHTSLGLSFGYDFLRQKPCLLYHTRIVKNIGITLRKH